MARQFLMAVVAGALLLSACGKNEPLVPIGYQAPPPPGGGYQQPPGYYPPTGPNPYFRPQLPPGYPTQYTPFLPIDQYMRRTPPLQQYWTQFWYGWEQYSFQRGYNPYDFSRFWFEYCPQQWSYTQYADLYNYFDQNVYYWVDPYMSFQVSDPGYFWQYYDWMPYAPVDAYGYCDGYCY